MTPEEAAKTASQIRLILAQDSCFKSADGTQNGSGNVLPIRKTVRGIRGYVKSIGVKFQRKFVKFIHFHEFKSTSMKEGEL